MARSATSRNSGRRDGARVRTCAIALACGVFASCNKDDDAATAGDATGVASTTGPTSDAATDSKDDTAGVSDSSSGGEHGDPAVIEAACTAVCELDLGCGSGPPLFDSIEACVAECVLRQEQRFGDGCGPETLAQLMCIAGLTCEEWLEQKESGDNICPDGTSACPD